MLTATQHRTLHFIQRYMNQQGYAPSLDEIAAGIGIRSKGTAHRHVQALAEAGYLRLMPGRKRGIQLPGDMPGAALRLPLLGRIAAGRPIEAISNPETIDVPPQLRTPNRCYVLEVRGDSMIDEGILDGDWVVIEHREQARNGEIVVALVDGEEATLKRLEQKPNEVVLHPANERLEPMHFSPERVQVQGVLVGQMRRYH